MNRSPSDAARMAPRFVQIRRCDNAISERSVHVRETVLQKMARRIAAIDAAAATEAADLMTARRRRGQPGDLRDTLIAGIVPAHHATLATRNTSHFPDLSVSVVGPWIA